MHVCNIMRDNISMDRQNTLKRDNAYNMKHSSLKMFTSKWVIIWALQQKYPSSLLKGHGTSV